VVRLGDRLVLDQRDVVPVHHDRRLGGAADGDDERRRVGDPPAERDGHAD
jgi:hypothetical protein